MKLSLVVLTPGKTEGKVIPVTLSQFVIGRDPQCHLRPASAVISKRHCALIMRDGKAYVRDFDSTNGTAVNDVPVKGEVELNHDDRLKVGPLLFGVRIETPPPVNRPTPAPPVKKPAPAPAPAPAAGDDDIAAMLLSMQDDGAGVLSSPTGEVPEGSTEMDMAVPPQEGGPSNGAPNGSEKAAAEKVKQQKSTSTAAKEILDKYWRRPRS